MLMVVSQGSKQGWIWRFQICSFELNSVFGVVSTGTPGGAPWGCLLSGQLLAAAYSRGAVS